MDRKKRLPDYNNPNGRKLLRLFSDTLQEVRALYFQALQENNTSKAQRLLRQLSQISMALESEYKDWSKVELTREYVKGAYYIDDVMQNGEIYLAVNKIPYDELKDMVSDLGTIHVNAVKALIDTSDMYVKASLDWMERVAIQTLDKTIQEKFTEELAKSVLKWETMGEMKRGAIELLKAEHITEFQDRAWRYWSMDRYAEMLVRTETNRANVQGTINRAIQIWITKFQIVEQPDCCEVCAEMNGDIVDVTEWTVDLPPFHPNCRGYIIAQIETDPMKVKI